MKSVKIFLVFVVIATLVSLSGCFLAAPTLAPPTVYQVGQAAEKNGIEIVLNNYEVVDTTQVHLNFTITNKSQQEFVVSTRYTMEGQDSTGRKLVFVMCPSDELGGRIAPGESVTGNVCLTGFKTLDGARVLYDPTAQMAYTIAWELKQP